MNERLAAGGGFGMVIGGGAGIVFDPLFGSSGMAMLVAAAIGLFFGAGLAALLGPRSKSSE